MPVNIPPIRNNYKNPEVSYEVVEKNKKIMERLRDADRDKDGSFNKDELKNALKELGAYLPGWRANRCLDNADVNHDGLISGDEIDALLDYLRSVGYNPAASMLKEKLLDILRLLRCSQFSCDT